MFRSLLGEYSNQSLQEFDLNGGLNETVEIIRQFKIRRPDKVDTLLKLLIMLEGTTHQLDPWFSLAELIRPYGQRSIMHSLSPKHVARRAQANWEQWRRLIERRPCDAADILHILKKGDFDVHLGHRKLDQVVDRMVMGILIAALFIGSSLMLRLKVAPISVFQPLGTSAAVPRSSSEYDYCEQSTNPAM